MSRTVRNRRSAYDNIAVGSAITTRERTIAGSLPSTPVYGGGSNLAVGSVFSTTDPHENLAVAGTDVCTSERLTA